MSSTQASIEARLDGLRRDSAWRLDPVRFRYLEAMARRLAGQDAAVRGLLEARLAQALDDYSQRLAAAQVAAQVAAQAPAQATPATTRRPSARTAARTGASAIAAAGGGTCQPLAQLNAYIRSVSPSAAVETTPAGPDAHSEAGAPAPRAELASARRFRQAWTRQRAQAEVAAAVMRKPANAGPLNSHALALQSLACIQACSTDYLRRFMLQVESLQWLERAALHYPAAPANGKAAKAAKSSKVTKAGTRAAIQAGTRASKAPARSSRARKQGQEQAPQEPGEPQS